MRRDWITLLAALVALLPVGCPDGGQSTGTSLLGELDVADADSGDSTDDADAEYRQRVAAWLAIDDDHDGLSNRIELDFGLDPDDPTDGPDIDGDGIPNFRDQDIDGDGMLNETDPDIDGDDQCNLLDADMDGDGVANRDDFDMDADGVRNEWDWDDDSDGEDDSGASDDDLGGLGDEDLRFSAAVQAINDKIAAAAELSDPQLRDRALAQYRDDLHALLGQVSKVQHEEQPLPVDGQEVELIAKSLANRFKWGGSAELAFELKTTISQLTPLHGSPDPEDPTAFTDPDPSDAIEAVYRQATGVKDPGEPKSAQELKDRLDALVALKSRLRQKEVTATACSDAVSGLVVLPGEGEPLERVEVATVVWDGLDEPNMDQLMGTLSEMTNSLVDHLDSWSWKTLSDALTLPGEGTVQEKFDGLMRVCDVMDEPDLDALVDGLKELADVLEQRIEGGWGWDAMIDALEGAPGIEDGIDSDVIDYVVDQVEET